MKDTDEARSTMSNGEGDPFSWSSSDPFSWGSADDPAGQEIYFSTSGDMDDYLVGTVYDTPRPASGQPPEDVPGICDRYDIDASIAMQQSAKHEDVPDLEKIIESFLNSNEKISFHIEEIPSKCMMGDDGILDIEREQPMKIKVEGAQIGQIVKVSMRFKHESHCHEPVNACPKHKKQDELNPDGTFFISSKNLVKYVLENEHPTAFITLTEKEGFCIYPIFRCWNSCFVKKKKKSQEMILSLYDMTGTEILHETSFDVRVCVQVVRDQEERTRKCPRKPAAKKRGHLMEPAAQTSQHLQEAGPPSCKCRRFMVEMEDSVLVSAAHAIVKLGGGKVIELDPPSHPKKCSQ